MPVGTAGAVKAVLHRDLREIGARILLANTYHLMLRRATRSWPGSAASTALPAGTALSSPTAAATRSSPSPALRKLDEEGVVFQSHLDGTAYLLSPSGRWRSRRTWGGRRHGLRRVPARRRAARGRGRGTARTSRWARRSRAPTGGRTSGSSASSRAECTSTCGRRARASSWTSTSRLRGGWALSGRAQAGRDRCSSTSTPSCPRPSPLSHGGGDPRGSLRRRGRGIDMFDCVLPTRNARNGQLFTRRGRLSIRNAKYRDPPPPPTRLPLPDLPDREPGVPPPSPPGGRDGGATLMTLHNLFYYLDMMREVRQSIRLCRFARHPGRLRRAARLPALVIVRKEQPLPKANPT